MVNKFHYPRGGAERIHFLVGNLMADAGHEVAHLSMRHPHNEPSIWSEYFLEEVDYHAAPWQGGAWKAARRLFGGADVANAVRQIVADTSPDVAVLGNIYHQLGQSTLMEELRRAGIPMVQMLHDFKIVCPSYLLLRNGRPCELCAHGRFHNAAKHGCGGSRLRGGAACNGGISSISSMAVCRCVCCSQSISDRPSSRDGFPPSHSTHPQSG